MPEEEQKREWGKIQLCTHCGDRMSGSAKFDDKCSTAPKRLEMCKLENEHWQKQFGKNYPCPMNCTGNQLKQEPIPA